MSPLTGSDGSTIVSLRLHVDGRQSVIRRTPEGDYLSEIGESHRVATERYATFFGAMVGANKFMDSRGHDCQRRGCKSWLIGASLRAELAPPPPPIPEALIEPDLALPGGSVDVVPPPLISAPGDHGGSDERAGRQAVWGHLQA